METGSRQLFIYYRVAAAELAAVRAALRPVMESLRTAHAGLSARLLLRPSPAADGLCTLMEIYALAPDAQAAGIDAALQAAIEARAGAAVAPWLRGERHVEVFEEPPCAW